MEGYTHLFYGAQRRPVYLNEKDRKAIANRRALKERLNCTNFDIIFNHVVPDLPVPPPNASYFGFIRPSWEHSGAASCLDVDSKTSRIMLSMNNCPKHHVNSAKTFYFGSNKRLLNSDGSQCVLVNWPDHSLFVTSCDVAGDLRGVWKPVVDGTTQPTSIGSEPVRIVYTSDNQEFCLTRDMSEKLSERSFAVSLQPCVPDPNKEQHWVFTYNFKKDLGEASKQQGGPLKKLQQLGELHRKPWENRPRQQPGDMGPRPLRRRIKGV